MEKKQVGQSNNNELKAAQGKTRDDDDVNSRPTSADDSNSAGESSFGYDADRDSDFGSSSSDSSSSDSSLSSDEYDASGESTADSWESYCSDPDCGKNIPGKPAGSADSDEDQGSADSDEDQGSADSDEDQESADSDENQGSASNVGINGSTAGEAGGGQSQKKTEKAAAVEKKPDDSPSSCSSEEAVGWTRNMFFEDKNAEELLVHLLLTIPPYGKLSELLMLEICGALKQRYVIDDPRLYVEEYLEKHFDWKAVQELQKDACSIPNLLDVKEGCFDFDFHLADGRKYNSERDGPYDEFIKRGREDGK